MVINLLLVFCGTQDLFPFFVANKISSLILYILRSPVKASCNLTATLLMVLNSIKLNSTHLCLTSLWRENMQRQNEATGVGGSVRSRPLTSVTHLPPWLFHQHTCKERERIHNSFSEHI